VRASQGQYLIHLRTSTGRPQLNYAPMGGRHRICSAIAPKHKAAGYHRNTRAEPPLRDSAAFPWIVCAVPNQVAARDTLHVCRQRLAINYVCVAPASQPHVVAATGPRRDLLYQGRGFVMLGLSCGSAAAAA
jgi:hypothetical protein